PGSNPDDRDSDHQYDFDQWLSGGNMEDPWLRYWAQGNVTKQGSALTPDCSGADCQPIPWFDAGTLDNTDNHSNIVKNVSAETCPNFPYDFWKNLAKSGMPDVHFFAWDAASGLYREN